MSPRLLEMAEECFASQLEQSHPALVLPGQSRSCKGRGGWDLKENGRARRALMNPINQSQSRARSLPAAFPALPRLREL